MNKDTVKGHWKELKGKIHTQWGKITDDELEQMRGTTQELIGALETKYGYGKERAQSEIKSFMEKNGWYSDGNGESLMDKAKEEIQIYSEKVHDVVADYVQKKPFTALGIAALVGAGIALLIRR